MTALVSREPIKVIADILTSELGLDSDKIILEYQKFDIPPDPDLFIALTYISGKAIGNNNSAEDAGFDRENNNLGMTEIQQVAMQHSIQIDLMSFDSSARTRKEEVIMALQSSFSQRLQDVNDMQIARIPSEFQNTSSLEETKILNRFTMTIIVKSVYTRTKDLGGTYPYYDNFTKEVDYDNQNP